MRQRPAAKLEETLRAGPNGELEASGVTFLNPQVCSAILCDYNNLKTTSEGAFHTDLWALMFSFDELMRKALRPYPLLQKIVECKICGKQNIEIQKTLEEEF